MKTYRAAVIGCSRMGGFIDNEVIDYPAIVLPYSHGAGFYASERVDLVACSDMRTDVMEQFGKRYDVPKERQDELILLKPESSTAKNMIFI